MIADPDGWQHQLGNASAALLATRQNKTSDRIALDQSADLAAIHETARTGRDTRSKAETDRTS